MASGGNGNGGRNNERQVVDPPPVVIMQPTFNNLPNFDPSSITLSDWFELFENFCFLNDIEREPVVVGPARTPYNKRRALFLGHLAIRPFQYLARTCLPKKPKDLKIEELYDILEKRYQRPGLIQTNRFYLSKRDQRPNESIQDYVCALQDLASNCNLGASWDETIRDRLIGGIRSHSARVKALDKQPNSLADATEILLQDEAVVEQARVLSQFQVNRVATAVQQPVNPRSNQNNQFNQNNKKQPKNKQGKYQNHQYQQYQQNQQPDSKGCYRCGRNHDPQTCFAKKLRCKKCSLIGHLANKCQTKRSRINNLQPQAGPSGSGPNPQLVHQQPQPQPEAPKPQNFHPLLQGMFGSSA